MPIKIMLDAGHFGAAYNRSPVVPDYYESNMTWVLCHELKAELEKYGFEVGTTRDNKYADLSLEKRGQAAEGCDLFISLHSDASGSSKPDHVSVYHSFDNRNNSELLAAKLAAAIADTMQVSAGYVKTRESQDYPGIEYYTVLNHARKVGAPLYYIIEHSFHTNKHAAKWLLDPNNLKRLAAVEAAIIASYYDMDDITVKGDVDGDGRLTAKDYMIVKRAVLGTIELTEEQERAADVSGDGRLDSRDYMMIKRAVMGTYNL